MSFFTRHFLPLHVFENVDIYQLKKYHLISVEIFLKKATAFTTHLKKKFYQVLTEHHFSSLASKILLMCTVCLYL